MGRIGELGDSSSDPFDFVERVKNRPKTKPASLKRADRVEEVLDRVGVSCGAGLDRLEVDFVGVKEREEVRIDVRVATVAAVLELEQ